MSGSLSRHGQTHTTPQTQPIPGRESEMVRNQAGGFSFAKDVWTQLQDFIILGTEGHSYYADERSRTLRNVKIVRQAMGEGGVRAVALAVEISTARPARATKPYPALYVVAAALASDDLPTRQAAADAVGQVARTTDHLAHLFGYYKSMKGKSSGRSGRSAMSSPVTRRAWVSWFRAQEPDQVAYQILKGRQRKTGDGEPFSPGDLLRLARPIPQNPVENALFGLATGKVSALEASGFLSNAKAFYEAQLADTPAKAVRAINAYHIPWEFLPTEVLKSPAVWEALVPTLGITALIRNLARMTQLGVLGPFKQSNARVAARLTDQSVLHRGRVHPFDLFLALKVYESGRAQPNPTAPVRTWTPVPEIVTALNTAYTLSFGVFDKVPGNLVVAVDSSGSMTGYSVQHGGSDLGTAYGVSLAFAQILMRTWGGSVYPLNFDGQVHPSPLRADMSLSEVMSRSDNRGGRTDCAQPILWALQHRHHVDGFVMLTDNASWSGNGHASQALADYRRVVNPAARVLWAATVPDGVTLGDPRDDGVLNVAGFDSQLPMLTSSFLSVR